MNRLHQTVRGAETAIGALVIGYVAVEIGRSLYRDGRAAIRKWLA